MPKKSYTLAPLREMSFFGVPRRGCQGVGGYATKATLKTLTQSVKEFSFANPKHFLLARVVDERDLLAQNGLDRQGS